MEFRQIRYFQAVAQEGHFRAAAARLSVAQPAVSQQIRQLERELGVLLFDRTSRTVRLSTAGEIFLERVHRITAEIDNAVEEMAEFHGTVRGDLRLGVLHTLGVEAFGLPELLRAFTTGYPETRAIIRESSGPDLFQWLLDGEVQLSFLTLPNTGTVPRGISTEAFLTGEMVVIVSANHPLASRDEIALEELKNERFVAFRGGSVTREVLLAQAKSAGFEPEISFEVGDAQMLRALAAQELAVALVPQWCYKALDPPLACLHLAGAPITVTVALAWSPTFYRGPVVRAFLDLAKRHLHPHR